MGTAERYRVFAAREGRGVSPAYERLALAVAGHAGVLDRLDRLPGPKRQPNLLFAAARYLGGPVTDPAAFPDWALRHWADLAATMLARRTQTNEPARCAVLLPVLARLPQPLALLEVGASAGLCLFPDAYRYRYGDHVVGPADSPVCVDCAVDGPVPLPGRVPTVAWRAGIDLHPLDVRDADDLRWLDALIWPEHARRRTVLHAAARLARADPPRIVGGDALADLPALAAEAPAGATLVVFHSAVLAYLPVEARIAFAELVAGLPGHWVSNEGLGVFPRLDAAVPVRTGGPAPFLLALDGHPLALTAPHGQSLHWLSREARQ